MGTVNNHGRAEYVDLEPFEAKLSGYDLVSLKYDGIWCKMVGKGSKLEYYSRDGLLKRVQTCIDKQYDFELVGEFMFGSQWAKTYGLEGNFYAFDMYRLGDTDVSVLPYINRLDYVSTTVDQLPNNIKKVFMRGIGELDYMRKAFVLEGGEYDGAFEGLVFHKSNSSQLKFARWKKTFTLECIITGYKEGKRGTRLEGNLGALVTRIPNGKSMDVGGGLSDDLRRLIWDNRPLFLGSVIEVEGKGVFSSGKLRHPNLTRFHPDKNTEEICNLLRLKKVYY